MEKTVFAKTLRHSLVKSELELVAGWQQYCVLGQEACTPQEVLFVIFYSVPFILQDTTILTSVRLENVMVRLRFEYKCTFSG